MKKVFLLFLSTLFFLTSLTAQETVPTAIRLFSWAPVENSRKYQIDIEKKQLDESPVENNQSVKSDNSEWKLYFSEITKDCEVTVELEVGQYRISVSTFNVLGKKTQSAYMEFEITSDDVIPPGEKEIPVTEVRIQRPANFSYVHAGVSIFPDSFEDQFKGAIFIRAEADYFTWNFFNGGIGLLYIPRFNPSEGFNQELAVVTSVTLVPTWEYFAPFFGFEFAYSFIDSQAPSFADNNFCLALKSGFRITDYADLRADVRFNNFITSGLGHLEFSLGIDARIPVKKTNVLEKEKVVKAKNLELKNGSPFTDAKNWQTAKSYSVEAATIRYKKFDYQSIKISGKALTSEEAEKQQPVQISPQLLNFFQNGKKLSFTVIGDGNKYIFRVVEKDGKYADYKFETTKNKEKTIKIKYSKLGIQKDSVESFYIIPEPDSTEDLNARFFGFVVK